MHAQMKEVLLHMKMANQDGLTSHVPATSMAKADSPLPLHMHAKEMLLCGV